ncbi:hypothetical protein ACFVX3_32685 [Rhodococcus erythropolis]
MSNRFRREAAVLAAYLAQFDYTDRTAAVHERLRGDYLQASAWTAVTEPSRDDTAALARMRRYYGFPSTT